MPQQNYPPATPTTASNMADPPPADPKESSQPPSQQAGIISPCVGSLHNVAVQTVPSRTAAAARSRGWTVRTAPTSW